MEYETTSPDPTNPTYAFEWRIDGKRIKTSYVQRSNLWERFNQAAEWVYADPVRRSASYYGPGVMRVLVGEYARNRLREILEPLGLVPEEPHYIGLLWADLGQGYELHKIRKETEHLEGYERPHSLVYSLVRVDDDKIRAAFAWASDMIWRDHGVWINDKPALVFCFDVQGAYKALAEIERVRRLLHNGKVVDAPAAYDWNGVDNDYPFIKPTRSRRKIQDHRSRWPSATDVLWTPKPLLIERYGYGANQGGLNPLLAVM